MHSSDWSATLQQVLIEPRLFFEDRSPDLGGAARVVGLVALVQAVLASGVVLLIGAQLSVLQEINVGELILSILIAVPILSVINWLVVSGILHVLIKLLNGNGTF
ncbi:MAG: hypothetical protein ACI8XM_001518 [Haloarculaceae archaeon]|jgi:hypothetical protein